MTRQPGQPWRRSPQSISKKIQILPVCTSLGARRKGRAACTTAVLSEEKLAAACARAQPSMRSALLLALGLPVAQAVAVEGVKGPNQHVHGDVDPDEFLWSKLPGRCCFDVKEICPFETAPRSTCKHVAPDTCRDCSTWSTPENYCHGSRENCESCGMQLYCASPPPLLDGNKVLLRRLQNLRDSLELCAMQ